MTQPPPPKIGNDGEFTEDVPVYVLHDPEPQQQFWHVERISPLRNFLKSGKFRVLVIIVCCAAFIVLLHTISVLNQAPKITTYLDPPVDNAYASIAREYQAETCSLSELTQGINMLVLRTVQYIYTLSPEGEIICSLSADGLGEKVPTRSPDHQHIAYRQSGETQDTIVLQHVTNGNRLEIVPDIPIADYLAWSPDGRWLAYFGEDQIGSHIFIVNPWEGAASIREIGAGMYPSWLYTGHIGYWQQQQANSTYSYNTQSINATTTEELYCCLAKTPTGPVTFINNGESYLLEHSRYYPSSYSSSEIVPDGYKHLTKSPYTMQVTAVWRDNIDGSHHISIMDLLEGGEREVLSVDEEIYDLAWW